MAGPIAYVDIRTVMDKFGETRWPLFRARHES
jgi:hypothetical protein